jgi:hypothetical protein
MGTPTLSFIALSPAMVPFTPLKVTLVLSGTPVAPMGSGLSRLWWRVRGNDLCGIHPETDGRVVNLLATDMVTVSWPVGGARSQIGSELGVYGSVSPFSPQNVLS